eukprot:gene16984-18696_t
MSKRREEYKDNLLMRTIIQEQDAKISRQVKQLEKLSLDQAVVIQTKCDMLLEVIKLKNLLEMKNVVMEQAKNERERLKKMLRADAMVSDSDSNNNNHRKYTKKSSSSDFGVPLLKKIEQTRESIRSTRKRLQIVEQENCSKDVEIEVLEQKLRDAALQIDKKKRDEASAISFRPSSPGQRKFKVRKSLDKRDPGFNKKQPSMLRRCSHII